MIDIQEHILLAPLTTFQIGGDATYFTEAHNEDEIREAIVWAQKKEVQFFILAGGSNVLISDEGFDGLVIHISPKSDMRQTPYPTSGSSVWVSDAGCNLLSLIRASAEKGLGGWEKLAGIPGSIGGAVRGNAGAFGIEIKDVVTQVHALNAKTLEVKHFTNDECAFAYRQSFFKSHPEWIITSVHVRLAQIDPAESLQLIEKTIAERHKRHLQDVKAAGSYFMNPVAPHHVVEMFEQEKQVRARAGRVPAGWLIEKAGMKGASVGGATASIQHPNYIINTGNATSADVIELAERIKDVVERQFGVQLQEEVMRVCCAQHF
jgi:UDP-N-acetylmuramate dehydrogenase